MPFHAKTGMPDAAMAAAAWSWVEKMLHEVQVISAPRDLSVSMRTAVWMAGAGSAGVIFESSQQPTHVQAASNAGALQRLVCRVLLARHHQTGHLVLGELNLATAKGRETDVGDLVLMGGGRHDSGSVMDGFEEIGGEWYQKRRREKKGKERGFM
jgi:hypothetical protein